MNDFVTEKREIIAIPRHLLLNFIFSCRFVVMCTFVLGVFWWSVVHLKKYDVVRRRIFNRWMVSRAASVGWVPRENTENTHPTLNIEHSL